MPVTTPEEFVQPKSILTPTVAGGITMLIANALSVTFGAPPRYTAIALSLVLGVFLVTTSQGSKPWLRVVYYVVNCLIIFSVSMGSNAALAAWTRPAMGNAVLGPPGAPGAAGPATPAGARPFFGEW